MTDAQAYDYGFRDGLWRIEGLIANLPPKRRTTYIEGYMMGMRARVLGLEPHEVAVLIGEIEAWLEGVDGGPY